MSVSGIYLITWLISNQVTSEFPDKEERKQQVHICIAVRIRIHYLNKLKKEAESRLIHIMANMSPAIDHSTSKKIRRFTQKQIRYQNIFKRKITTSFHVRTDSLNRLIGG